MKTYLNWLVLFYGVFNVFWQVNLQTSAVEKWEIKLTQVAIRAIGNTILKYLQNCWAAVIIFLHAI